MRRSHSFRNAYRLAGVAFLMIALCGCSQKIVNDDTDGAAVSFNMKVSSPELMEMVTKFRVTVTTVTPEDMDSIVTWLTTLENGRYVVTDLEVPAGCRLRVQIEAFDEDNTVIYSGVEYTIVEAGQNRDVPIDLVPVVELVKLSPRFAQVPDNSIFRVFVKAYNLDSLYNISFRIHWDKTLVWPDSAGVVVGLDSSVEFITFPIDSQLMEFPISITQTDQVTPIVDSNGYANLAVVYFHSDSIAVGIDTVNLSIDVTALTYLGSSDSDSIFVDSVKTDGSVIEVGVDPIVQFPDPVLDRVIRDTINKPDGPLYLSDVIPVDTIVVIDESVGDLTGLSNLSNLVCLVLPPGTVSDLSELSRLTNLQILWIASNRISDLTPLQRLTSLRGLHLGYNQISDLTPLENLLELEVLLLGGNQVTDFSPLGNLVQLRGLDLSDNQIADPTPLNSLTELQALWLYESQLTDISFLADFVKLQELDISKNQISDITPLDTLVELQRLNLSENQITDISSLANLIELRNFYAAYNQISDITVLENFTYLQIVSLKENQIIDILALSSLDSLEVVELNGNDITDIGPLVENTGINSGDWIYLTGNPLNVVSQNAYITELRNRGVEVFF
ncbi:MAG: leucine-rich repeat domain-containing protein [candidate division Zixibacteria bacterium]|nr:leucine-rich repeat domain-containing protein [candidate division Zixibacteria bacterium]